ncbi:unnamed protein product [Mytilus coruscus]|uniref:Uncharacterized protein n=1 Tax=Mytilus coruscus TaxID=42192 RepID=A0A6J8CT33_MYTCO|nr:unnamed protein product [Mytilus coruscus]
MFSGNYTTKIVSLFDQMKLKGISERSVRRQQTAYTSCAVIYEFDSQQADVITSLQGPDKQVVLDGDGRCDSPGYSAKYGSYTLMDLNTNKILDIQLVQSNEVKGSTHMELEGLKRGLSLLMDTNNIEVSTLVTDRHVMIKKFMKDNHPEINHYIDVWHIAKVHQTYGLEVYHSLVNQYAPKNTHFFQYAMKARIYIAALHYNENGNRQQAVTKAGILKWKKSYPKAKNKRRAMCCQTAESLNNVGALLKRTFDRRNNFKEALEDFNVVYQRLPPLTASNIYFDKKELIRHRTGRFARN